MLDVFSLALPARLKVRPKPANRFRQHIDTFILRRHRAHHWWMPPLPRRHQRQHRIQLNAMLSLVTPREGWHPPVVRTVASENKGIDVLAETVGRFRTHFEASGERKRKHVEHWKQRLIELLESRLLQRALGGAGGEARLTQLAEEVAARKKHPFSAVNDILKRSGLDGAV